MNVDAEDHQPSGQNKVKTPSDCLVESVDGYLYSFEDPDRPFRYQSPIGEIVPSHDVFNMGGSWSSDPASWLSDYSYHMGPETYSEDQVDWPNTGLEDVAMLSLGPSLDEPENWPTPKFKAKNSDRSSALISAVGCDDDILQPFSNPMERNTFISRDFEETPSTPSLELSGSLRLGLKRLNETNKEKVKQEENEDTSSSYISVSEFEGSSEISSSFSRRCSECQQLFARSSDMEQHAKETRHKPFFCSYKICTARFSRQDALTRHRDVHGSTLQFPCTKCDKYKDGDAFKRRDYLLQHMKKAHGMSREALHPKFCCHASCSYSGSDGRFWGFRNRREHSWHMRDVHGEGTLDCKEIGCDRVGKKGFARKRDLEIHVQKIHRRLQ